MEKKNSSMKTNKNPMFAHIPSDQPSFRVAYELWLKEHSPLPAKSRVAPPNPGEVLNVGIIGGGMSGLYSALVLLLAGHKVHVFEANEERLGGRVYTHRFNDDPNQYFEAGAMRLPEIPEQQPVFDLISFLNERIDPELQIQLIPYILFDKTGNRVLVNGAKDKNGNIMTVDYANSNPEELDFVLDPADKGKSAQELVDEVIQPFLDAMKEDFDKGFKEVVKFDDYSFRSYLALVAGWTEEKINYAEVMTSQTNQFQNSFTELVIENMDFTQAKWKSIDNGMDHLPLACAEVIGHENISMGAKAYKLENTQDGKVAIHFLGSSEPQIFDKVIAAIPPASLKMMDVPQWSSPKTQAIRALHYEPLYKIGMRFETRFWEKTAQPSNGGQSISDLPSRWFVYPSYGIGEDEKGVLLLYSWMTDANAWIPLPESERLRLALRDLQTIYPDVDIASQYIESFAVSWSEKWATGDAMFFPGQFKNLFNVAREPEGNIFFAGEHLSVHHTWIVGACDSALVACQQILGDEELESIKPNAGAKTAKSHDYNYAGIF